MSNENENTPKVSGGKKSEGLKSTQLIAIFGIIILAVLVAGVTLILKRLSAPQETPYAGGGVPGPQGWVVDESNLAEVEEAMTQQAEEGYFETEMNLIWTFPTWEEASIDAYVANSAANLYPAYFTVTLDETGETVYTSALMPVGMGLKEVRLAKEVPPGEHTATCTFYLVDDTVSDKEEQGKGSVAVGLTVVVQG